MLEEYEEYRHHKSDIIRYAKATPELTRERDDNPTRMRRWRIGATLCCMAVQMSPLSGEQRKADTRKDAPSALAQSLGYEMNLYTSPVSTEEFCHLQLRPTQRTRIFKHAVTPP